MKSLKKVFCVVLCILLCFVQCFIAASAAQTLPESAHPYENNSELTWEYVYPGGVDGFFITFSEDFYLEPQDVVFLDGDGNPVELTLEEALEMDWDEFDSKVADISFKDGDSLEIYNDEYTVGTYTGDSLAGETVYISGDTAKLRLTSDDSVSGYGFAVESVSAEAPEGILTVSYCLGEDHYPMVNCFKAGEEAYILDAGGAFTGNKAYAAWSTAEGGKAEYDGGEEFTITEDITLYPVYADILLTSDEVFSFDNEYEPFSVNEIDVNEDETDPLYITNYYMESEDYAQMFRNLTSAGIISPMFIPAAIAAGNMLTYPLSMWGGSCYGMSLTVALQHYGMLDLLSYQEGAANVSELEPSPKLVSCINYYQAQEMTARMTQTVADYPGTPWYSAQLKNMYNEVASGKIVLFGFYENHSFDSSGHAILLTGAYDDLEGNHILLAYDCNYGSWYTDGVATRLIIDPDFNVMASEMYGLITGFDWLSDLSGFDSFRIDGGGDSLSWFRSMINHIRSVFQTILDFFRNLFR